MSVSVVTCVFFWGASAGMVFPFPTSFFLDLRSFLSLSHKRALHYVTRGSCRFIHVETHG